MLKSEIKNIIITTFYDCNIKVDLNILNAIDLAVDRINTNELIESLEKGLSHENRKTYTT